MICDHGIDVQGLRTCPRCDETTLAVEAGDYIELKSGKAFSRGEVVDAIDLLTNLCFGVANDSGWWLDLETGEPKERNIPELLALIHSEVSEALEGFRKDLDDSHLTGFKNFDVEMADILIRVFDANGGLSLRVANALFEKVLYNQTRSDHKISNRKKEGGKSI